MFMSRLRVAAIAACVCATEAPTVSQPQTATLPAIYYDDFETPWALRLRAGVPSRVHLGRR